MRNQAATIILLLASLEALAAPLLLTFFSLAAHA